MQFDPNNNIVKLCVEGMLREGEGKDDEASKLFQQAWSESSNDVERFMAAHYVARHQTCVSDKLRWDETALSLALKLDEKDIKGAYPSLYLNVGKCYEDLNNFSKAQENYLLAYSYRDLLTQDGYGKMIISGIENGIDRVTR